MSVLVDHSAKPVSATYVQTGDSLRIADRFGECAQGCRLSEGLMGSVGVVVKLELAESVAQVAFVPDEGAVQEFVSAGLNPALHDGVHTWHPHPGEHGLNPGSCQDLVEEGGELRIPVPDQVRNGGSSILKIHHEVAFSLAHPRGGGVRRGAENPDATGGVLDDRKDVLASAGKGDALDEVAGQQRVGLSPPLSA